MPGSAEPAGDPLGGDQQAGAEPAGGAQRHHVGAGAPSARGKSVGKSRMPRTSAPRNAVDRLVRVADHDQVAAVAGERPEQRDLAGVGVLVLVDEDVRNWRAQLVAVRLGLDRGAADQVGVVGGALVVEVGEVLLEEQPGGDELRQALGLARARRSVLAVEALLAGPGRARRAPRGRSRGCRARARSDSGQRTDSGWSVSSSRSTTSCSGADSSRSGAVVELGRRVAADQPVGEGVERRAQRGRHRAAEPGGDPVAQLLGGLAGEGQRQHLVGLRAALLDPVDDRLDQRRGLAGAGAGEHQQRPARVVDDALLVLVERGHVDRHVGPHQAVRRGSGRHVASQPPGADNW